MIEIIREYFKYILPVIIGVFAFLLCWGAGFMIGKIVMRLLGVL